MKGKARERLLMGVGEKRVVMAAEDEENGGSCEAVGGEETVGVERRELLGLPREWLVSR